MKRNAKKEVRRSESSHSAKFASFGKSFVWSGCIVAAWTLPLYPAVQINLDASLGKGNALTSAALGAVVFGAVCVEAFFMSIKKREWQVAAISLPLAFLCLTFNVWNSIGNTSTNSEHSRDDRASQIERKKRQKAIFASSQKARDEQAAIAGEATPASVEAEIRGKQSGDAKRWNATNGCDVSKITAGPTREFCSEVAKLQSKLDAAKRRDELDATIKGLDANNLGDVPTSIDPTADSVTGFLEAFGMHPSQELMIHGKDWILAVLVEFMAIFGPALLMYLLGKASAPTEKPKAKAMAAVKAAAASIGGEVKPAPVEVLAVSSDRNEDAAMYDFAESKLERFDGVHMPAPQLFQLWEAYCSEIGADAGTKKAFSQRVRRYFAYDLNNNRPRYLNVRAKTSQPAIRMVISR